MHQVQTSHLQHSEARFHNMATGRLGEGNTSIQPTIVDAKGDIIVATAADTVARLAVGTNDQVLTADSSTATGLKWATPSSGGMTLISETVASGLSSLSFTSLGSYKQLLLVWGGIRHSTTGSVFTIRLNNSSSSIYNSGGISFSQTSGTAQGDNQDSIFRSNPAAGYAFGESVTFGNLYTDASGQLLIDNYTSTTKSKNYFGWWGYLQNSAVSYRAVNLAGVFDSTSAITSIDIVRVGGSATFSNQSNTTIRLYGIS